MIDNKRKKKKKKVKIIKSTDCWVAREKIPYIDYKDLDTLGRFMTPHGKLMNRYRAGVSTQAMRDAKKAIKRAQHIALLPYKVY